MTRRINSYIAVIICTYVAITSSIPLYSQSHTTNDKESNRKLNQAEGYFIYDQDYLNASRIYEELFETDSLNNNLAYKLGICYLNIRGMERKSLDLLKFASKRYTSDINYTASGSSAPIDVLYYLAYSNQVNMNLEMAIEYYKDYLSKLSPENKEESEYIRRQINSCRNTIEATKDGVMLKRRLFTPWMGSYHNAVNPVVSGNDSVFIFTKKTENSCIIYCSTKTDTGWSEPKNITAQLGKYNDMYSNSLTFDGKQLIIARNDGFRGNLYISEFSNGKWSKISRLGKNINTKYWESHGCITPDGTGLYFASNRPGGMGSLDLYYAQLTNKKTFGPAINLGKTINTRFEENTPCFDASSKLLYFSSNGHEGFGGYDIFVSRKEEQWSEPLNLPFPVNTTFDDLNYFPYQGNNNGLYSTYPDESSTYSTIFYYTHGIESESENISVRGHITLRNKDDIVSDSLKIEIFTGYGPDPVKELTQSDPGIFSFDMKIRKFRVYISYPGYINDTILMDIPEDYIAENVQIDRMLIPESDKDGKFLSVNNILFDFDSFSLNNKAITELEKILVTMLSYPGYIVEIAGYTDPLGSVDYNLELSKKRANAVKNYFVKSGVNSKNLITIAQGEGNYIALNNNPDGSDNPEGRKYNRRVNLSIKSEDYNISIGSDRFVPRHLRSRTAPGYYVVLLESTKRLSPNCDELNNIREISFVKEDTTDGIYKYFVGEFLTRSEANSYLNTVRESGYNKAYLSSEYEIGELRKKSNSKLSSYTIQLHALRNPSNDSSDKLPNISIYKGKDGFYRYVCGEYYGYRNATQALEKIHNLGFKQAFIKEISLLKQQSIIE